MFKNKIKTILLSVIASFIMVMPAFCAVQEDQVSSVFAVGNTLGMAYYHLLNSSNSCKTIETCNYKDDYQVAFQNVNISDLYLDKLTLNQENTAVLNSLRFDIYSIFNKKKSTKLELDIALKKFSFYYDSLLENVKSKYEDQGTWLINLGFYTGFQSESIGSGLDSKVLLSGFDKIYENLPFDVSGNVLEVFKNIYNLDKKNLTRVNITEFKDNLDKIITFYNEYSSSKCPVVLR